jgi:hypothetical protein
MMQAQFFITGVLLIWLVSTGKLGALMSALAADPSPTRPTSSQPSGTTGINPGGGITVIGPDGTPLDVFG